MQHGFAIEARTVHLQSGLFYGENLCEPEYSNRLALLVRMQFATHSENFQTSFKACSGVLKT